MTTFQINTDNIPLTVDVPWLTPVTHEQLAEFCLANPDLRVERTAAGELVVMSPTHSDTGNRNFNLAVQLGIWVTQNKTGIGFDSSAGFMLPNGATRSPDASWIRIERWNSLSDDEKASFAPICPDFVIELRSASDRLSTVQEKMQEYIDNGIQLGWLIDRQTRQLSIYRPGNKVEVLDNPTIVQGDPVLPGFVLTLDAIW